MTSFINNGKPRKAKISNKCDSTDCVSSSRSKNSADGINNEEDGIIENQEIELDNIKKKEDENICTEKRYHMAAAFNLNILFEITTRNMLRCTELIKILDDHLTSLFSDANLCPNSLFINALTTTISFILKLLYYVSMHIKFCLIRIYYLRYSIFI